MDICVLSYLLFLQEYKRNYCTVLAELIRFETVNHSILLQRLEHVIGIKGTALGWFKSYLSHRFKFVLVNEESFSHTRVSHGDPQASVFGPILFILYMLPLGNIIRQHGINSHFYADDTQL